MQDVYTYVPSQAFFQQLPYPVVVGTQDLKVKTAAWSKLFYGSLDYLPCYAATGQHLQLVAIERGAPPQPIAVSPSFDMCSLAGRAQIVLASFNLYRLLSAVSIQLPAYLLPVGMDIPVVTKFRQHEFKRILHFRADTATVQKRIQPWTSFCAAYCMQIEWLQQAYKQTAKSAGLVHMQPGSPEPSVRVDDVYTIELMPVGLRNGDCLPQTEQQACSACHGLLHGLQALHQVRLQHLPF